MHWSKIKNKIESRFADSVRGKVHVYTTVYTSGGNRCRCGRGWLTVNGEQIANFETIPNLNKTYVGGGPTNKYGHLTFEQENRTVGQLVEKGEFSRMHFLDACTEFLQLSIDAALSSDNALIRGLAYLDARAGKRRLATFTEKEEHPLAKKLLEVRLNGTPEKVQDIQCSVS